MPDLAQNADLHAITARLVEAMEALSFGGVVDRVYNPLVYAQAPHAAYLDRFGGGEKEAIFLGMNPGPWGMAQTGVPFGEIAAVRDWMGISGEIGHPPDEHPKRPVLGFSSPRSEVSGRRLWGWAADRFGSAEQFFRRFFVVNYCPLLFLAETARNVTPDKLSASERAAVESACDEALRETVRVLHPQRVIGVGTWAEKRARAACTGMPVEFGRILHPSPASPAANRGWAPQAEKQLLALGVKLP